jgi:hypothetical protein
MAVHDSATGASPSGAGPPDATKESGVFGSYDYTHECGTPALASPPQPEEAFDGSELIEYRHRIQRLGEDLLTERDRLTASEVQLGAALGRVATLEDQLRRYELAVRDLERLRRLPFWGLLSRYLQLRTAIGHRIRSLLPRQD